MHASMVHIIKTISPEDCLGVTHLSSAMGHLVHIKNKRMDVSGNARDRSRTVGYIFVLDKGLTATCSCFDGGLMAVLIHQGVPVIRRSEIRGVVLPRSHSVPSTPQKRPNRGREELGSFASL